MAEQHEELTNIGNGQKTLSSYLMGFGLSIFLTLAAFGIVASKQLTHTQVYITLLVLALIQLLVQSVCFLRLNFSKEGKLNSLPFIFILVIIAIIIAGTIWIMYNLNYNMFS